MRSARSLGFRMDPDAREVMMARAMWIEVVRAMNRYRGMAGLPPVTGVKLSPKIEEAVVAGQPRRVWRMVAQASVGRVEKRLTAVLDQGLISMQAGRAGSGPGGFVYWREE